jgi:hypothetical protein
MHFLNSCILLPHDEKAFNFQGILREEHIHFLIKKKKKTGHNFLSCAILTKSSATSVSKKNLRVYDIWTVKEKTKEKLRKHVSRQTNYCCGQIKKQTYS